MDNISDLEILSDMLGGDTVDPFGEIIEQGKEHHYYNSFGLHLLKQFENKEQYYHFLLTILKDFKNLDEEKKKNLMNVMEIFQKPIIQEKIIYKQAKQQRKKKPQLNINNDY
tara:strand:- start:3 stop:338 length:336 start_codon:yes stop_codon:yes gene_type:complete